MAFQMRLERLEGTRLLGSRGSCAEISVYERSASNNCFMSRLEIVIMLQRFRMSYCSSGSSFGIKINFVMKDSLFSSIELVNVPKGNKKFSLDRLK